MKKSKESLAKETLGGIISSPLEKGYLDKNSRVEDTQTNNGQREGLQVSPKLRAALHRERTKNSGRPKILDNTGRPSSAAGLRENYIRATFIVDTEILDKIKNEICYIEGKTIKTLINDILKDYVTKWEKKNHTIK